MTTPDQHAQVAGSWMATAAGWLVSLWQWFSGEAVTFAWMLFRS